MRSGQVETQRAVESVHGRDAQNRLEQTNVFAFLDAAIPRGQIPRVGAMALEFPPVCVRSAAEIDGVTGRVA